MISYHIRALDSYHAKQILKLIEYYPNLSSPGKALLITVALFMKTSKKGFRITTLTPEDIRGWRFTANTIEPNDRIFSSEKQPLAYILTAYWDIGSGLVHGGSWIIYPHHPVLYYVRKDNALYLRTDREPEKTLAKPIIETLEFEIYRTTGEKRKLGWSL